MFPVIVSLIYFPSTDTNQFYYKYNYFYWDLSKNKEAVHKCPNLYDKCEFGFQEHLFSEAGSAERTERPNEI